MNLLSLNLPNFKKINDLLTEINHLFYEINKSKIIKKTLFVFDIETTGLPNRINFDTYYPPTKIAEYDNSRVLSIGYTKMIYYENGEIEELPVFEKIINPVNYDINKIPNSNFHGITPEIIMKYGEDIENFAYDLFEMLSESDFIIAHNALFDINVLMSELFRRNGVKSMECYEKLEEIVKKNKYICTMKNGINICNIKQGNKLKNPNLAELYDHYYKKNPTLKLHNAKNDVTVLRDIVKKMNLFDI
jgi:DNA polymerase III epsilon subunit-like protein